MVRANKSMLPGATKTKKSTSSIFLQVLNKTDAFSEKVGIPSAVIKKHMDYDRDILKDWEGDKNSFKEFTKKNYGTSPIGKYIKSWTKMNPDKAKVFIKDPYNYKRD
tara:strand:+ start:293 stop:613 length:321 start_codon:yes stop_codon:yes gene_type:complete